jgi:DNA mismatch repair protein MutL
MGQIEVLDRNMVNMIAAGEVIERPASVVKELMENSIDAGATKIAVSIEDGGRKLISVTDNGCGMDAEDLGQAFEPHATSKIKTSKDLRAISTLGFRGEALASIASIAQVKAVSRRKDSTSGNSIEIDCGDKVSISPASSDYGTTIQVRDLFYKLPARRKFLKTANTEMGHIIEQFTRIALARDDLDLTLIHNGRELYQLAGRQNIRKRINELFPSELAENLLDVESDEKKIHIFALMGGPSDSRTSNKFQYVFLNGRFIRDKFISHAIKEAYRGTMEPTRFPVVFLFIQMPYEDYDVNVHPTKIEVRFYNANLVHSQVLGCLREKLLAANLQPQARLGEGRSRSGAKLPMAAGPSGAEVPTAGHRGREIADAMAEFFRKHKPSPAQQQFTREPIDAEWMAKYKVDGIERETLQSKRKFIQIHDSFIVAPIDDGFIIIDQHALHERIIYEVLSKRLRESKLESQRLLIPESFELTEAQIDVIKANAELIDKLGIELVPFGPRTYAIQAFPTLLAKAAPVDFVRDLIDLLADKGVSLDAQGIFNEVLNMTACKAAIKAGQKLSDNEIEQLLADREKAGFTSHCPHGRPTTIKFSMAELQKQFKRT